MQRLRSAGKTRINAREDAEKDWKKLVNDLHSTSVRDKTEGWYMGTNVPGKPREALNYNGGIPQYLKTIKSVKDNDLEGFEVQ